MTANKKPVRPQRPGTPLRVENQASERLLISRSEEHYFSGPLPPPEALAQYEQVVPGFGDRLLTTFEAQSAHRIASEAKVIDGNVRAQQRGQAFAFVIAMSVLAFAAMLAWRGHLTQAVVVLFGEIIALCGTFLIGRRSQASYLAAKRNQK